MSAVSAENAIDAIARIVISLSVVIFMSQLK